MRAELVLADLDDDASELKKSNAIAGGINAKHKDRVTAGELKVERGKIEVARDLKNADGDEFSDRNGDADKNIEYWAMINALDAQLLPV